jgi:S1-C subfamily serine protease
MMFCKHCGKQIGAETKFCKFCGQPRSIETNNTDSNESRTSSDHSVAHAAQPQKSKKWIWIAASVIVGIIILSIVVSVFARKAETSKQPTTNANNNLKAVVDIWCDNGQGGSGTIFTSDGTVLTNNHVITGATSCQVTIPDPETGQIAEIYQAAPVITPTLSQEYDVATLKIDGSYTDASGTTWGAYPTTFPVFTIPSTCNTSTQSQLNDSVRIYGYPVTSGGYNLTVTDGIISSFADDGDILTSAKVDSGNSGGLAIDQNGCWLGIPSAVVSGNYQNLGVIIPGSVVAKNFLNSVPAKFEPIAVSSDTEDLSPSTEAAPQETNSQVCQDSFGTYSQWSGKMDSSGNPTCNCQTGYSWDGSGGACATQTSLQAFCQNQYGSGSYSYLQSGKAVCGCDTGYKWNSAQTACVVIPEETNDQKCQDQYGTYSDWSGQTDSNGRPTCDCQTGYSWDGSGNECATQVSLNQSCENSYGYGSYSYPQDGKAVCGCDTGYEWNSDQTACVSAYQP